MKLVHLVGFIIKKFVTMHGHMNVKLSYEFVMDCLKLLLEDGEDREDRQAQEHIR